MVTSAQRQGMTEEAFQSGLNAIKISMDRMTYLAQKAKFKERREPLYWIAMQNGVEVGRNNSIALLRHIWKAEKKTIFKAVR
jgi:hypothetical protein